MKNIIKISLAIVGVAGALILGFVIDKLYLSTNPTVNMQAANLFPLIQDDLELLRNGEFGRTDIQVVASRAYELQDLALPQEEIEAIQRIFAQIDTPFSDASIYLNTSAFYRIYDESDFGLFLMVEDSRERGFTNLGIYYMEEKPRTYLSRIDLGNGYWVVKQENRRA